MGYSSLQHKVLSVKCGFLARLGALSLSPPGQVSEQRVLLQLGCGPPPWEGTRSVHSGPRSPEQLQPHPRWPLSSLRAQTSPTRAEHRNRVGGGGGLPPWWLEGVSPSLQVASSGRGEAETGTGQALQPWVWVEREEKVSQAENRTVQRWEPEFPAGCV